MTSPNDKLTITRALWDELESYAMDYAATGNAQLVAYKFHEAESHATIDPAPREPQIGDVIKHGSCDDDLIDWIISQNGASFQLLYEGCCSGDWLRENTTLITNTDSLAEFLRICEGES